MQIVQTVLVQRTLRSSFRFIWSIILISMQFNLETLKFNFDYSVYDGLYRCFLESIYFRKEVELL